MDTTAFSLALGILVLVLSYSCLGISWTLSLLMTLGTTIAIWIAQHVTKYREYTKWHASKREEAVAVWRKGAARAKSLEASKT